LAISGIAPAPVQEQGEGEKQDGGTGERDPAAAIAHVARRRASESNERVITGVVACDAV
jgi:hypothetical protein